MKTILITSLLVTGLGTNALANPVVATATDVRETDDLQRSEREEVLAFVALKAARAHVAATRARWDAAVADDRPQLAGTWARRHFEAMQDRKAALARWEAAAARVNALRFSAARW